MADRHVSELEFLLKIQRILDEGDFVVTYKFALLNALADISVENDVDPGRSLDVSLAAIAEKFIEYYWRQSRPYRAVDGRGAVLKQNTGGQAAVINAVVKLQQNTPALGAARNGTDWPKLCRRVSGIIDKMPLWKLQNVGGEADEFLYLKTEFSAGCIRLLPGVPQAFRTLHGLIVDAVRAWIRQITRIAANRQLLGAADLSLFLFGSSRRSLGDFAHVCGNIRLPNACIARNRSGIVVRWTTSYLGLDIRWTWGITWFWHIKNATPPSETSWLIPHISTVGSDRTSKGRTSLPSVSMPASSHMISTAPRPSSGGPMSMVS